MVMDWARPLQMQKMHFIAPWPWIFQPAELLEMSFSSLWIIYDQLFYWSSINYISLCFFFVDSHKNTSIQIEILRKPHPRKHENSLTIGLNLEFVHSCSTLLKLHANLRFAHLIFISFLFHSVGEWLVTWLDGFPKLPGYLSLAPFSLTKALLL